METSATVTTASPAVHARRSVASRRSQSIRVLIASTLAFTVRFIWMYFTEVRSTEAFGRNAMPLVYRP